MQRTRSVFPHEAPLSSRLITPHRSATVSDRGTLHSDEHDLSCLRTFASGSSSATSAHQSPYTPVDHLSRLLPAKSQRTVEHASDLLQAQTSMISASVRGSVQSFRPSLKILTGPPVTPPRSHAPLQAPASPKTASHHDSDDGYMQASPSRTKPILLSNYWTTAQRESYSTYGNGADTSSAAPSATATLRTAPSRLSSSDRSARYSSSSLDNYSAQWQPAQHDWQSRPQTSSPLRPVALVAGPTSRATRSRTSEGPQSPGFPLPYITSTSFDVPSLRATPVVERGRSDERREAGGTWLSGLSPWRNSPIGARTSRSSHRLSTENGSVHQAQVQQGAILTNPAGWLLIVKQLSNGQQEDQPSMLLPLCQSKEAQQTLIAEELGLDHDAARGIEILIE